ncbi:hypothetical protein TREMEDRAFT_56612 [Tremella mesenterica DSM 1558]|nr:uncharacterized protein TREMEDRAFT_56612 [Tremella mesenterica DSM 1558]EIW70520.1 hypothetical protein TREMEDRAFT_56612 [Tremella mesenterica DSM 1558]
MSRWPELDALMWSNLKWAERVNEAEPKFFEATTEGQAPKILWMGCADSRVPETVLLGRKPGDVFVQRNVANQFQPDDTSSNALLNYAVMFVGCTHIIVAGHTCCGGCIAAYESPRTGNPDTHLHNFLAPIIKLRHELPEESSVDDLIEANVKLNVENVANSQTMQEAWGKGMQVYVHGWMYDLGSGRVRDLGCTMGPPPKEPSAQISTPAIPTKL